MSGRRPATSSAIASLAIPHPHAHESLPPSGSPQPALPTYLRLELTLSEPPSPASSDPLDLTGGVLRGLLGKVLVDAFCPFGEPRCDPKGRDRSGPLPAPTDLCHLAARCPYGVLYAASQSRRPPYALFVGPSETDTTNPTLEITLFGPAWRLYPWIVAVLQGALEGERPVSAVHRLRPDRSRERLSAGSLSELPADLEPDLLTPAPEPFVAPRRVAIELLSPTMLLTKGKPIPADQPVPFDNLIKSTLDRFAGLYGAGASEILSKSVRATVEAEAARVPLVDDQTTWQEAAHLSRRSRHTLALGGRVGRLVYGEQASWFFHILRAAEILHLGKNPTFGNGRLQVDLAEE